MHCKYNHYISQTIGFVIENIKFVIDNPSCNIKFVISSIKFVIVSPPFSRIMRAREDRHNRRCLDRNKAFKPFLSRRKRLLDGLQ